MSKIINQRQFKSALLNAEAREIENQEWKDGQVEIETESKEKPIFCFVEAADFSWVKLLEFNTTDDMDIEIGELDKEFRDGERISYPVYD